MYSLEFTVYHSDVLDDQLIIIGFFFLQSFALGLLITKPTWL